jgi:hypothetical protein
VCAERSSKPTQDSHRRVPSASLYATQVGQIDLSIVRKLLLSQLSLDPQSAHVCRDDFVPVHSARLETRSGSRSRDYSPYSVDRAE